MIENMKKKHIIFSLLSLVAIGAGLASCTADESSTTAPVPQTSNSSDDNTHGSSTTGTDSDVEVSSISTTISSLSLKEGENKSFTYSVSPDNAADKTITLEFDEEIISAKISGNTISVTGLKEGSATLTLKAANGVKKTIQVTVVKGEVEETLSASVTSLSLAVDETKTFTYTVTPADTAVSLDFDSSYIDAKTEANNTISVTGKKEGTTTLTLKTAGGKSVSVSITITSNETEVLPTSISCNFDRSVIGVGEQLQLEVTFEPENTTAKNLRYLSNNLSVATISSTGLLTGVAAGEANITISSRDAQIDPIILTVRVSADEKEVGQDKLKTNINKAIENEASDITSGSITYVSKGRNSTEAETFKNEYQVYENAIYNNVTDFDGNQHLDYYGLYENQVYHVSQAEGKNITEQLYTISESSFFQNEVSPEEAYKMISLPEISPYSYSSSYERGIGSYIQSYLLNLIFFNQVSEGTEISVSGDTITISLEKDLISYYQQYSLELTFESDNLKSVHYKFDEYRAEDIDENQQLIEGASPIAYDDFQATLTSGEKAVEEKPAINPADFFYQEFTAGFYTNYDSDVAQTTFNVMDNIIFKLQDYLPSTASSYFDRIEIKEVSDPEVLSLSPNKTSLIAIKAGTCDVTLASKNVTETYTLTVVNPTIQSLSFSSGLSDTIASDERVTFQVNREPVGAIDDIKVELSEGAEAYATLGMTTYDYYYLQGNPNMTEKEATIKVIAYSESHPEVRVEKEVKIVKRLTDKEIESILLSQIFTSDKNAEYGNYYATISFKTGDDDRAGVFTIYTSNDAVFETCHFTWSIANGFVTITKEVYTNNYVRNLSINFNVPDLSSFEVSIIDATGSDEYDGNEYTFIMRRN